jgi:hypothetical protein
MNININELLNGYTCTNGRWNRKGDIKDLLSRDDLLRLLQQKFSKPGIKNEETKAIILSIFEYVTHNRDPCPVTGYPIIGSHPDQILHMNTPNGPIDYSAHDIDSEIPLLDGDKFVLLEQINKWPFNKIGRISPSSSEINTIIITLGRIRIGNKYGRVELFINVTNGIISLSKIRFRPYKI